MANEAKGTKVVGAKSLKEMVSKLKKPRRIILLVKAGQAVDDFIEKLVRPALLKALLKALLAPQSLCLFLLLMSYFRDVFIFSFWIRTNQF